MSPSALACPASRKGVLPARDAAGARFAALGAELVRGADRLLELIGLDKRLREASFVVTGEGTVDRTTAVGKAPGAVARLAQEAGVRCVVFGGRIVEALEDATTPLPSRANRHAPGAISLLWAALFASSSIRPCAASSCPRQKA